MKVGVLFPPRFVEPGEMLADARAMEAAHVDSIWVQDDVEGLDPWLVLAAIAAATSQVRLGVLPRVAGEKLDPADRRVSTLQSLSGNRVIDGDERWEAVEVPADRPAWATTLLQARPGVDGVLVPLDPRLLDILRNPDGEIDRSDLVLAQG